MTAIRSRIVEGPDGDKAVHANCRDCGNRLILPCEDELGHRLEPTDFALKWADMLVCERCYDQIESRRAARENREQFDQRIKQSRVPHNFREKTFAEIDRTGDRGRAVSAAWAWAEASPHDNAGVLLHGPPGTGKTTIAAAAAMHRMNRYPLAWASVAHIIAALGASFTDDDRKHAVEILTGSGALMLDDLDKVRPSEYVLQHIFVAIDRRIQAGSPLFVTSNAAPDQLYEKFGGPITSRLIGYCHVIELAGWDRRLGN